MATEAVLVRKILQKLKAEYGMGVWYKIHTGPFQERGVPDIMGCLRGRFIAFEVKTPDNKDGVTNYQKLQLDRISSAEGKTAVVTSVKEVTDFLKKNFYKIRPKPVLKDHIKSIPNAVESTVESTVEGENTDGTESGTKAQTRKDRRSRSGKANRRKPDKS